VKPENYPRLASWACVSFLLAISIYYHDARQATHGYDAYITAAQLQWAHSVLHPHLFRLVLPSLVACGIFIVMYELISIIFRKAVKK
jgi:hypothetical protein